MITTNSTEFLALFEGRDRETQLQILDRVLSLANVGENAERMQQDLDNAREHEEELRELLSLIREKNKNNEEKRKKAEAEVRKLETENLRLRSAAPAAAATVDPGWEKEKQKLTSERDGLKKAASALSEEKKTWTAEKSRLTTELMQLRQQQQNVMQGWESERRQILENYSNLQKQYQTLAASAAGQGNWAVEKQQLEKECAEWKKKHDLQRMAKEEQTKKAKEMEARIVRLTSMETENQRLKKAYDKLEAEKKTLASKLARLEVEKNQHQQQAAAAPKVDEKARRRNEKSTALTDDEMRRRGKNMPSVGGSAPVGNGKDRIMQQISELEAENANLKNQQQELETTNAALQRELNALQNDDETAKTIAQLKAEKQQMTDALEEAKVERQKMTDMQFDMVAQNADLAKELEKVKAEHRKIADAHSEMESRNAELSRKLIQAETDRQQMLSVRSKMESKNDSLARELEEARAEQKKMNDAHSEMKAKNSELATEKQRLAEEKDQLVAQKKALEEELETLRSFSVQSSAPEKKAEEKPSAPEKKAEEKPSAPEKKAEEKPSKPEKKAEEKPSEPEKKAEEKPSAPEKKAEEKPSAPEKKAEEKPSEPEKKAEEKPSEPEEKAEETPSSEETPVEEVGSAEVKKEEAATEELTYEEIKSFKQEEILASVEKAATIAPTEDFTGSLHDLHTATSSKGLDKLKPKFLAVKLNLDDGTERLVQGAPKKKAYFVLVDKKVFPNPYFFRNFGQGGESAKNIQNLDTAFTIYGLDHPGGKYVLGAIEPAKVKEPERPKDGYVILQKGRLKLVQKG